MDVLDLPDDADRVRDGVRLFNEGHFFEAHEVLEDVWHRERGPARTFLQGLIQLSAAYHHFQNGNYVGAVELLKRGADKMRNYPSGYLGLRAGDLIEHADADRGRIEAIRQDAAAKAVLEFPQIVFETA